jgi:hypothetical protein
VSLLEKYPRSLNVGFDNDKYVGDSKLKIGYFDTIKVFDSC